MTFLKRSTPPQKLSPKTEAKRTAAGEKFITSTIAGPRKKPKPRNAKRAKANHERAYGEYAAHIRTLPCLVCKVVRSRMEAAHSTTGGMGRKADASTLVPLCGNRFSVGELIEGCHPRLHRVGVRTFEKAWGIDLKAIAASLWADWQKQSENVSAAGPL